MVTCGLPPLRWPVSACYLFTHWKRVGALANGFLTCQKFSRTRKKFFALGRVPASVIGRILHALRVSASFYELAARKHSPERAGFVDVA